MSAGAWPIFRNSSSSARWVIRLRRQQHADDAAHRRADPIDLFATGARSKRHHVGKILRIVVIGGTGEPVAAAAAGDVGTEDLPVGLKKAARII
jgi:hypothetical protein